MHCAVSLFINLSVSDEAVSETEAVFGRRWCDYREDKRQGMEHPVGSTWLLSVSQLQEARTPLPQRTYSFLATSISVTSQTSGWVEKGIRWEEKRFHLRNFQKYTHCFFFVSLSVSDGSRKHAHGSVYLLWLRMKKVDQKRKEVVRNVRNKRQCAVPLQ